jgi:zinc protease
VPRSPTVEPEQNGERRAIVFFDVRGPLLAAAWHAPPSGHEDGPALDVLSVILSDGRSSRLYRNLVYEGQVALFAHGAYWELVDAGLFFAFAGVRPDADIHDVERRFMAEIERLRTEPVSAAELDKAKRQLEVSLVEGLRTNHNLGSRVARDFATFGRIRPLSELLAQIQNVTAADVQRVAESYLLDEKRSVVHVVKASKDAS